MNPEEFAKWREELIFCGDIVQDEDDSVLQKEAEDRFNRYIELLDAVEGKGGEEVFAAIVDSITPKEDYGSFERVIGTLSVFPTKNRGMFLAKSLLNLVRKSPEKAIDILFCVISNDGDDLKAFNSTWATLPENEIRQILDFVTDNEKPGEYLDEIVGRFRPTKN